MPQPVEQRGADAPDFDHALDQFLRIGDGELPGVGGKPLAAQGQVNQVVLRLLLEPHGADSADHLDELAVLAAADQLLGGRRLRRGHDPLPQHLDRSWDHDGRVFTGAGLPLNLNQLTGQQRRAVGHLIQIDAGRFILHKSRIEPRVKKSHHGLEPHLDVLLGLFRAEPAHLVRMAQYPVRQVLRGGGPRTGQRKD